MTFLYPMMLWALALPPLLAVLALLRRHREGAAWRRLVSPAHVGRLVVQTPVWRSTLPPILTLAALTLGIIAAARPIHGYTSTEAVASGRNLLIALDISRSMETQDVKPSRLEEARAAAFELVDALPGDKIGLIVFSGEADLVVPLTYDHTALRDALEQVNRGWAGYGGTNFGLVLRKAMQDFTRSAPTGTNALVIFSDGEDTVGSSLDIAKEAREKNLLVITVGVGTPVGDSIPDARGENGLYQDAEGKHVISKLDTAALQRFAEATGGDFFTMGSGADLAAFARQAVKKLDTHEETFSAHKVPRDLFTPFALAALLLLIAAILLATEWKAARPAVPLLLLFCFLASAGSLQAAPGEESLRAYGNALAHMGEDADKAREGFSRALLDEDADMQAACLYELGNLNATATFEKLRALYGQAPPEAGDSETEEEEGLDELPGEAQAAPGSPSPEQLQDIVDELSKGLQPYRDALGIRPSMEPAQANIRNIEAFIDKLKEEIERLKQQQQQNQQGGENDQQQKPEGKEGEQQDDQQQKPEGQEGDQQDDQQQKPEGQEGEQQDDQQQKPEGQEGEQQDNQQQKPEGQEGEQQDNQQQKPEGQEGEQQDNQQPAPPRPQQPQPEKSPLSDRQKAEQRAASILKMHTDEEQGSPIPHSNNAVRPPEKDY